jgi:hypothetical protein
MNRFRFLGLVAFVAGISSLNSCGGHGDKKNAVELPVGSEPVFSPPAGSYTTPQTVTISVAAAGATIYFTADGTTPTTSSAVYSGPITIAKTETLSAIAAESGFSPSGVATAAYTLTLPASAPVFSPPAGSYSTAQSVAVTDDTPMR